ncbi:hypothetical protein GCM10008905_16430 [Clostridium malenominatum]|uniref:YhcN/YlaJ family sporulation lipoprotein n=1 Tax=Clostridium malenominatum TaxID=1539 RepID=A0ABN1IXW3_9CLOT
MNTALRKKALAFLVSTLVTSNLLACTNTNNKNNTIKQDINKTQNAVENKEQNTAELTQRADKIAKELTNIKGVNSANVLISNERALVGIDINKNLEGNATNNLKTEVENKVKSVDSKIKTVAVSADADTLQIIRNIGQGVSAGKPLSEFGNEVEELFRRILPK